MVRGRRKIQYTNGSQTSSPLEISPSKSKSRQKFKGKLSHTSPMTSNKITDYFDKKQAICEVETKCWECSETIVNFQLNSAVIEDTERKVLHDANSRLENNNVRKQCITGQSKTIKTESCVPFSNTALSKLSPCNSRKSSKARKKLVVVNENPLDNAEINSKKIPVNTVDSQTILTEYFPIRRSVRKTGKKVLEEKRRTIEEAILLKKENGLKVRIFEGKGRGVVASRNFKKGEFVVEYAGELISMDEAQRREIMYARNENIGCYMYYFKLGNSQHCIDATAETGRLGRLINHSRYGNLSTKTVEVRGVPHLILLAKEDIDAGMELTYDYGDRSKVSLQYHPWLAR